MNYLSKPADVQNPIEMGGSLQLAIGVANTLQSKYDANKAIVDQTIAQYESLRGLTPEDDAYIASQVSNVKNQISKLGSLNLAHNTGRDSILNNMKNVLKDPIVQDILVSKANKDKLDAEYQEIVKKDLSKGDSRNYEYALTQGGYYDYVNGKTKKIGGMSYKPYEDVTGNYTKRLKEYVDQYDDEQYMGTKTTQYQTVDIYGKRILKADLENFLVTTTTGSEAQQLNINAWHKYKDVKESEVVGLLKPVYKKQVADLKLQEAAIKAQADTGDETAKENLKKIKTIISETTTKSDRTDFTKKDLYSYETNSFISNMASLYDKDIVTKRDTDNLPFEILKFNTDTALKIRSIEADERANALKEEENKLTTSAMGGDAVVRETPDEEKKLTDVEKSQKKLNQTATSLDMYLSQNVDDYDDMSAQQKWEYKLNFNPSDLTVKGNKNTALVLANDFRDSQKQYSEMASATENSVRKAVKDSYNSLIGGSANIGNLAKTMPLTASLLQNQKGVNFESLHNSQKKGLIAEWAANKMQYDKPDSKDVQSMYNAVIIKNKTELSKINSTVAKNVFETIKDSTDNTETGTITPIVKGVTSYIKNMVLDKSWERAGRLKNWITFGKDYAEEEFKKGMAQDAREFENQVSTGIKQISRDWIDRFGGEDTNITELEPRDLAVRGGKTSPDVQSKFRTLDTDVKAAVQDIAASYQANIKEFSAFNFSTEDKLQKQTAQRLRAAVLDIEGASVPKQTNDYTISREGSGYRVNYLNTKDEKVSVILPKLDSSVIGMIDEKKADWMKDPKNKKITLSPLAIKPITSPKDSQSRVEALVENIEDSGILAPQVLEDMRRNPANTPLASVADLVEKVKQQYGTDFYSRNRDKIEEILSDTYTAIPYSTGASFKVRIDYNDNGRIAPYYPETEIPEKDDATLFLMQLNSVMELKTRRIKELK